MVLHVCRNNDTVRDILCFVTIFAARATLVPHDDSAALVTVSPVLHIATPHVANDPYISCILPYVYHENHCTFYLNCQ